MHSNWEVNIGLWNSGVTAKMGWQRGWTRRKTAKVNKWPTICNAPYAMPVEAAFPVPTSNFHRHR
jgi:hypothetical protein